MSAKESLCKSLIAAATSVSRRPALAGLGVAGAIWAGASWAYVARRSTQTPLFRCTRASTTAAAETSAAQFDVIIVGAAIAGTVGAMQLAKQGRHVLVVERSLERPETIIGELLQPGGLEVLERVGLRHCATEVGVRAHGYAACLDGRWTDLPFEDGVEGVSFHHGDFVMRLRSEMRSWKEQNPNATGSITVVEGTVTQLLYGPQGSSTADRIVGVTYTRKGADVKSAAERAMAPLTVLCDGGGSNFKSRPPVHSRFFGFVLKDITLEFEERGNVILGRHGIILAYRLDPHEVRFLIDYGKGGAPPSQAEVQRWLREDIRPDIPERYRAAYDVAIQGEVRSMPHHHFTPLFPSARGMVGIGDHGNQRHPLTGAGMTCAMRDAVALAACTLLCSSSCASAQATALS
jgi:squalene monooxygenase